MIVIARREKVRVRVVKGTISNCVCYSFFCCSDVLFALNDVDVGLKPTMTTERDE